jgi:hypothetical protein
MQRDPPTWKDLRMNAQKSKNPELTARIVGGLAAMAAGFAARKAIEFGWKKVTGKEPPTEPESPEVALVEALSWAVVMGVGMEVTRLMATRVVARKLHRPAEILSD